MIISINFGDCLTVQKTLKTAILLRTVRHQAYNNATNAIEGMDKDHPQGACYKAAVQACWGASSQCQQDGCIGIRNSKSGTTYCDNCPVIRQACDLFDYVVAEEPLINN